jgi:uncharacterized protein with von Willebrand factor type A (vWA) domain
MTTPHAEPLTFRGVDRAVLAAALARRLRAAGVSVGVGGVEAFAAALGTADPLGRAGDARRLYWLARVTLVTRHDDLAAFDAVFAAVFGGDAGPRADPHARRTGTAGPRPADRSPGDGSATPGRVSPATPLPWVTRAAVARDAGPDDEDAAPAPDHAASTLRALATTPFDALDDAGLAALADRLEAALAARPERRSRRLDEHPRGVRLLPRPTLARVAATGGEPFELAAGRQRRVPRRLVVLVDVSRSMQPFAAAYLAVARAVARAGTAEVYAFSASLTRLTPALTRRGPDEALRLAEARAVDRFGGTRIATAVRELLADRHAAGCRGAVVLVASDGWDGDDPALLRDAMARLRRRAHRVVWVNPRAAAPGFAPATGGMAAALPYCDALLPGHTLEAIGDVGAALRDPGRRSGSGVSSTASRAPRGGSGPRSRRRRAASPGSRAASARS